MPNMAPIVVKKADGTTNFTFSVLTASPGDRGFAQWRGEGTMPSVCPNLRVKTQWNGARTARQFEASGNFPYVQTVNGVDTQLASFTFRYSGSVPMNMPSATAADIAAIVANAIASQLFKEVVSTGMSPN